MSTPKLIRHRRQVDDRWSTPDGDQHTLDRIAAGEDTLVPFALWQSLRDQPALAPAARRALIGVLLEPADDPDALVPDLDGIDLLAVRFPIFTDGRGYSTGRLLRERLGWRGPLMAVGDVLRDQLLMLERCGFDTFRLRQDQDVAAALTAFADFSESYQSSVGLAPLFARRQAERSQPDEPCLSAPQSGRP